MMIDARRFGKEIIETSRNTQETRHLLKIDKIYVADYKKTTRFTLIKRTSNYLSQVLNARLRTRNSSTSLQHARRTHWVHPEVQPLTERSVSGCASECTHLKPASRKETDGSNCAWKKMVGHRRARSRESRDI